MFYILYASTAVRPFTDTELGELLRVSRLNNAAANISGMLLYYEGSILQYIEGSEADVTALFHKISNDTRHLGIFALDKSSLESRALPEWTMGYKALNHEGLGRLGRFDFTKEALERSLDPDMPGLVLSMMRTFYKSAKRFAVD